MSDVTTGAFIAIGTAAGAAMSKVLGVRGERRRHSGTVETSDAAEIFRAGGDLIEHMQNEITRLDARIDAFVVENRTLRDSNAQLVVANHALIEKVDALSAENRALVDANHNLERRVEELLRYLGDERRPAADGLSPVARRRTQP